MRIKRINSIKKFGIYQDFKWDGTTSDFEDRNIIYGWNYSGKTTLSRLLSLLTNVNQQRASEIGFKITACEHDGSSQIYEEAIEDLIIYTFNSDYIDQNLHFEKAENPKIRGILFDIGEVSAEKRQLLNDTKLAIERTKAWFDSNHNSIDDFNSFEKIFTAEAKKIKNDVFESQIEFNRGHLKRIIESLNLTALDNYIISDSKELGRIKANALAKQAMSTIHLEQLIVDLDGIVKDINSLLVYAPQRIKEQPVLGSSSGMYEWGKYGLQFYLQNPQVKLCAFCGNPLENSRLEELNRFYSNEAAKLRSSIKETKSKLSVILANIANHLNSIASPNDIIESNRDAFALAKSEYLVALKELSDFINTIIECLNKKEDSHLFDKMSELVFPSVLHERFKKQSDKLFILIQSHNEVVSNFASIKAQSSDKLKKHCVARILKERGYCQIKKQKEQQEAEIIKKRKEEEALKIKYNEIQAEIKSLAKGQENLNEYIQKFLGRKDLEIHITEDDFFILKRGEEIASKLSEGEKTAIALSYFMVSLDIVRNDGLLKDAIVFIDDPISSLDANHIAQVSSLLNSFFFYKDSNGKICDHCAQMFISTHNFEFFSFIRDANNIKRNRNGSKCSIYMLKRTGENDVKLLNLPKTFSNYNSEYLYLFSEIFSYYKDGCPDSMSYLMPNIIRRFLEIYTRIKLPGNKDEIDNRIKLLMGHGVNELKVLHNFSHFTSLERVLKHSEIILRLPDIVEDLFKLIQKDENHYNSLLEGIGVSAIEDKDT